MCQTHCSGWLHTLLHLMPRGSSKGGVPILILIIGKLRLLRPRTHSNSMVGPRFNLCTLGSLFSFVKLIVNILSIFIHSFIHGETLLCQTRNVLGGGAAAAMQREIDPRGPRAGRIPFFWEKRSRVGPDTRALEASAPPPEGPRRYLEQMRAQFSANVVQGAGPTRVTPCLAEPCGDAEMPFSDGTPTQRAL